MISAIQRRHGKGLRLALLPGQAFAGDHVERQVDDVKRFEVRCAVAHLQVVAFGKTREAAGVALRVGGAEVGADQAIAVHAMKRELVDVDVARHDPAQREESRAAGDHVVPGRVFEKLIVLPPVGRRPPFVLGRTEEGARFVEQPVGERRKADHQGEHENGRREFEDVLCDHGADARLFRGATGRSGATTACSTSR